MSESTWTAAMAAEDLQERPVTGRTHTQDRSATWPDIESSSGLIYERSGDQIAFSATPTGSEGSWDLTGPPPPAARLMTAREVAEGLGYQTDTVLRWTRCCDLPGFRMPGGELRYRPSDVIAWLEARATARPGPTATATIRAAATEPFSGDSGEVV